MTWLTHLHFLRLAQRLLGNVALARRLARLPHRRLLEAADAQSAHTQLDKEKRRIDLLLTDVVLPGMNGRRLADEVVARANGMKVLFMTGYSRSAIVHHGASTRASR